MTDATDKVLLKAISDAGNAQTNEKRLTALAKDYPQHRELLAKIAAHTNTPLRVLLNIATAVPKEVLAHPAVGLASLGGASAFAKFPIHSVIAFLVHGAPPELYAWTKDPSIRRTGVERAAFRIARAVHEGRAEREANGPALLLLAEALSPAEPLRPEPFAELGTFFHAHYAHTSKEKLAELLRGALTPGNPQENLQVLAGLAKQPQLSEPQLQAILMRYLCSAGERGLFVDVESCSQAVEVLLTHPAWPKAATPPLLDLEPTAGEARDAVVRAAIRVSARTAQLPQAIRSSLVRRELTARMALASLSDLTSEECGLLAADSDYRVREQIAKRATTAPEELARLVLDAVPAVAIAALQNPACSTSSVSSALSHPRRGVRRAAVAIASAELLAHAEPALLAERDGLSRLAAATRKDAPPSLLTKLAGDKSPTIRRAVAKNRATPQAVLAELAKDTNPRVLDGLAKRPA
jgi:hypothetical protein